MAFCGLSSVASAGRMLYAFSRDDGLPGAGWLKKVSHRYRTPANSLTAIVVVVVAVHRGGVHRRDAAPPSSSSPRSARSSCTPRMASASTSGRRPRTGSSERVWSLGRWSKPIAWVAVVWVIVLMVLFSGRPRATSRGRSWSATVVLLLDLLLRLRAAHFKGPRSMGDSAELTEIEREFEHAAEEVAASLNAHQHPSRSRRGPAGSAGRPSNRHRTTSSKEPR